MVPGLCVVEAIDLLILLYITLLWMLSPASCRTCDIAGGTEPWSPVYFTAVEVVVRYCTGNGPRPPKG
jgi:hypothetical protein